MSNWATLETDKVMFSIHVRLLIYCHGGAASPLFFGVSVEVTISQNLEGNQTYLLDMNLAGWKGSKRFVREVAWVFRMTLTFSG